MKASRRQHVQQDPILDTYEFVDFDQTLRDPLSLQKSLVAALQIVLQNNSGFIRELKIGGVNHDQTEQKLLTNVKDILKKTALVAQEYFNCCEINTDVECDLIVLEESCDNLGDELKILDHLSDKGFILYHGSFSKLENWNLDTILKCATADGNLYLLRRFYEFPNKYSVIHIHNTRLTWIEELRNILENDANQLVYLVSQNENTSGVVGLNNCLRKESYSKKFIVVFLEEGSEKFSVEVPFFKNQLKKALAFNVLRQKKWGTFLHLPLEINDTKAVTNAEVEITTIGDLSTLRWVESLPVYAE